MIKKALYKIFGTRNDRLLKQYGKTVVKINNLEAKISKLSNNELQNKTQEFKDRLNNGETTANILPEVFAVCREASKRILNMRHFDVQLIGGMVLNDGKIAEMRTGEGKTLVATLAVYLNALGGKGVHVVTVNDYLAKRDALELGKLYNFLGLSVGINLPDMSHHEKQAAYMCDVTYGTNNEFGFDYLRDNMVFDLKDKVQRQMDFAIVDEVDSILIDEARTPLIISGPAEGTDELYIKLNKVPKLLNPQIEEKSEIGDFWVDEKSHNVVLSEKGHEKVENILVEMGLLKVGDSLYHVHNISLMHHLLSALKAHYVYHKDQHYVVQNKEVIIVDEFTGRLMSGRRWSDGLHQAVEAKEMVEIQKENQTMASITFQNYFRMYKKLSGMTGTADTEAYEFQQIYGLETVVIPTNKPMIRADYNDKIYMNLEDKYRAIIEEIKQCHAKGQPVLVGTTSVENSEIIASLLTKEKLKHEVLNAKQHAREADIIAQAGSIGAITVATNMAGRGTDIILGGNPKPSIAKIENNEILSENQKELQVTETMSKWKVQNQEVLKAGGLFIVGTERHESRRIDNQLRGRSGRQGDPGASRFYLSLDDPLLRIFGGERMRGMMQKLGMKPGESIEHKWLSRSIESAQRKVEGYNFDIRKQLLDYDNVANDQRHVIYQQRDEILRGNDLSETTENMIKAVISQLFDLHIPEKSMEDMWDIESLQKLLKSEFHLDYDIKEKLKQNPNIAQEDMRDELINLAVNTYKNKMADFAKKISTESNVADEITRFERGVLIQHIDHYWREHLTQLEQLRQGIHLRGYAQKDPKQEYKHESFNLFSQMLDGIKKDVVKVLLTVQIRDVDEISTDEFVPDNIEKQQMIHSLAPSILENSTTEKKISRNAACPCGTGKKYKHCCGKFI